MRTVVLAACLALIGPLAHAAPVHVGNLSIDHVWARSTAASSQTGAVYLSISNQGKDSDRLLSVSSNRAGQTQIHRSSVVNGVMQMRALEDGVAIAPGQSVKFMPGGLHVMLIGLKQPLKSGEHFALQLHFEKAGDQQLEVDVQKAPAPMEGMEMPMHMN
jgi:copper(I)-binding protein